jgi:hypothetical protein
VLDTRKEGRVASLVRVLLLGEAAVRLQMCKCM